jgi:cell division septum initiation protein DivIVA
MAEETQFRTVLRGFDPEQVKAALEEMQNALSTARRIAADRTIELTKMQEQLTQSRRQLDEATTRIADLERRSAQASTSPAADVGARIGSILALANEEAEELRAGGRQQAQRDLDEAAAAIAASRAELERYADGVRTGAHTQAGQIVDEARRTASEILAHASHEASIRRAEAEAIVESNRVQAAAVAEFGDQIAVHIDRLHLATARVEQFAQEEATLIQRQSQDSRDRIQRDMEHQLAAVDARRDSIKTQLTTVSALLHELGSAVGVAPSDVEADAAADRPMGGAMTQTGAVAGDGDESDLVEVTEQAFDQPDDGASHNEVEVHDEVGDEVGDEMGDEVTERSGAQELADWVEEGSVEDVDAVQDRQQTGARR